MSDRPSLWRGLTAPIASAVAIVVAVAWLLTWATSGFAMGLLGMGSMGAAGSIGALELAVFYAIMVVMMVAMMLPAAAPMVLAYHGMTRLEEGRPTKRADLAGTATFVAAYFLVWGTFSAVALLGLMVVGLAGPVMGLLALAPGAVLVAAGAYQFTRAKEVCLSHCGAPMAFVMHHWRSGRFGAFRMGFSHAMYCLGCCWLFMLVLFVSGSMSLVWMGALSVGIFAEKVSRRQALVARAIAVLLLVLGGILVARAVLAA